MAEDARAGRKPYSGELHDLLIALEDADPIEAAKLMVDILSGEVWDFECGDIALFGAQHNWRNPTAVGSLFTAASSCKETFGMNEYHARGAQP